MHINKTDISDLAALLHAVEVMDNRELAKIQTALNRRRRNLKGSTVLKHRDHRHGVLQLETRAYKRKDGGLTRRGPYWYFHYREGGKQKTLYVGKTDDPEAILDAKLRDKEE